MLPQDFLDQVKEAFNETFDDKLQDFELLVEGRIFPKEIVFRAGLLRSGELRQNNFEVSIDYKGDEAIQKIHDAVDVAASMMADFLESHGEIEFPRDWEEFEFEKTKVFCRYSTENTQLENEADRLLGEQDPNLLKGSDDEETEDLISNEDDFDDQEDPHTPPKDRNKLH